MEVGEKTVAAKDQDLDFDVELLSDYLALTHRC